MEPEHTDSPAAWSQCQDWGALHRGLRWAWQPRSGKKETCSTFSSLCQKGKGKRRWINVPPQVLNGKGHCLPSSGFRGSISLVLWSGWRSPEPCHLPWAPQPCFPLGFPFSAGKKQGNGSRNSSPSPWLLPPADLGPDALQATPLNRHPSLPQVCRDLGKWRRDTQRRGSTLKASGGPQERQTLVLPCVWVLERGWE